MFVIRELMYADTLDVLVFDSVYTTFFSTLVIKQYNVRYI